MKKNLLYIRHYRQQRKMTQEQMADELEMSQRNYSKIENGETPITLDRLVKIAGLLNVTIAELLGENTNQLPQANVNDNERKLYRIIMDKMEQEIKYLRGLVYNQR